MFSEFELLRSSLIKISKTNKTKQIRKSIAKMLNIVDDVLKNKTSSQYFQMVCPFDTNASTVSQVRRITIDPQHVTAIKDSIIKVGGVRKALLLASTTASNQSFEVLNGNHRDAASKKLKKSDPNYQNFKYPAVVIPVSEYGAVHPVLPIVQAILNEEEPKKTNNENDIQKLMESIITGHKFDLNVKADYETLLEMCSLIFVHKSMTSIKSNLTRLKNKKNAQRSDVYCDSPNNFIEEFLNAHKGACQDKKHELCFFSLNGTKYKSCKINFMSMKGSVFDQAHFRDAKFKHANPSKKLLHVFACQDNKGDSQTTINSRISYFKSLYRAYEIYGAKGVSPDFIAITPQNKSSFMAKLGNTTIQTSPEIIKIAQSWIVVSKQQLLALFKQAQAAGTLPYKNDWIARELKQASLKVVSA